MGRLEQEIAELMKKKGFSSSRMTDEEFVEAVKEKTGELIPKLVSTAVNQVMQEVHKGDMKRIGKGEQCRYFGNMYGKPCSDVPHSIEVQYQASMDINVIWGTSDCAKCTQFRPLTWRQRLKPTSKITFLWEAALSIVSTFALVATILSGEVRIASLVVWYGMAMFFLWYNSWLLRQMLRERSKNLLTNL